MQRTIIYLPKNCYCNTFISSRTTDSDSRSKKDRFLACTNACLALGRYRSSSGHCRASDGCATEKNISAIARPTVHRVHPNRRWVHQLSAFSEQLQKPRCRSLFWTNIETQIQQLKYLQTMCSLSLLVSLTFEASCHWIEISSFRLLRPIRPGDQATSNDIVFLFFDSEYRIFKFQIFNID